ncbi:MAG TPA: IS21 family transposase [Deltaproteobacteria bacterium]|nr:IS21 family transposase [Deltaproteobacteria bacterium]
MTRERTSRPMQDQIKHLRKQGYSIRAIAKALSIHRRTVRRFLPEEDAHRLKEPPEGTSAPPCEDEAGLDVEMPTLDWASIGKERGRGVTLKQLHQELAPEIPYLRFWRAYHRQVPVVPETTVVLHHKPGEKTQIDYADGISIYDLKTGKKTETQFFCGVLAFSSYTYGEFALSQKLPSFLLSQQRMWSFFGGVTPYVIPDNLKSGVSRAHLYDPDVNPTYCDFANAMGFAVLPARPKKPKDKGAIESAIGVIQRSFYQEVRNRTFYSLDELNRTFWDFLGRLNASVMKDYGVSRKDRFEEERKQLKPLPQNPYEITEWKSAKVHPDCHIQVLKNFYSVPFSHVGQTVRVRLGQKMVEVFNGEGEAIAVHSRRMGQHGFSTDAHHYPEAKASLILFDITHAKTEAQNIGPETFALVNHLFEQPYPLQFLRRVQGILRLPKSNGIMAEAMEHACKLAMTFKKLRLAYIKSCALYYQKNGHRPAVAVPQRDVSTMHLHQKG